MDTERSTHHLEPVDVIDVQEQGQAAGRILREEHFAPTLELDRFRNDDHLAAIESYRDTRSVDDGTFERVVLCCGHINIQGSGVR